MMFQFSRARRRSPRAIIAPAAHLLAAGTCLSVVLAACGSDSNVGPSGQVQVASITVDTVSFAVERGTHLTLKATARNAKGDTVHVPFAWRSTNETAVGFQPDGQMAALDTGFSVVTASSLGVTSAPIGVQVIWNGAAKIAAFSFTAPIAASPGAVVGDSIRVQVTNRVGGPVPGAVVSFSVTAGGGTVTPTDTTDSNGVASAAWTLGGAAGVNTVSAAVIDDQKTPMSWVTGNPATFSIQAFQALVPVQGDAQTAQILSPLPVAPSVKLVDSAGNPRPGVVVTFTPSSGGRVASPTVSTGADGVASAGTWTLGDTPGTQTLVAKVGIATATLSATGTGTPIHYFPLSIIAGGSSTCAINADSTASCWGQQPNVGNGGATNVSVPTPTAGGKKFAALAGSQTHFCGTGTNAGIYCWGTNALTDTTGSTFSATTPSLLAAPGPWLQVAPGYGHNCALVADSTARCWGDDTFGELGDGTNSIHFAPVTVAGGFKFVSIVTGAEHSCGLTVGGSAFCWGLNANGQLGDGTTTNRLTPTAVGGGLTFQSLGAGGTWTCGLTTGGQAYCWGSALTTNATVTTPHGYTGAPVFTSLSVGGAHACALAGGGAAYCWGSNSGGQVGDSSTVTRDVPTAVAGGLKFSAISAGYAHTCALAKPDGSVACWGLNSAGEIGTSTVSSQLTPRFIVLGVTP